MKLKKRVKFTCVASCYRTKDVHCEKGWTVTLDEDDPRVLRFRNRSFKEEHLPPLPIAEEKPKQESDKKETGEDSGNDEGDDQDGDADIEYPLEECGIGKTLWLELLENAGFKSAKEVLEVGADGLKSISGIGEKTATEIIKLCEKAVGKTEESKNEDEE